MNPMPLQGYIMCSFMGGDDKREFHTFAVKQAILSDDGKGYKLAIDFDCGPQGGEYTIVLKGEDPLFFQGDWSRKDDSTKGSCTCRRYSSGTHLALIGAWQEESGAQQWIAELSL